MNELWTNNNSESLNNRIKQSTNWKPQKLPDLIHKLNEISSFQLNDLRRAIHGNGNYILDDTVKRHHVSPDVWVKMSKTEKQKRTWKLLTQKPVDPDRRNHIISTKCSFKVKSYYYFKYFKSIYYHWALHLNCAMCSKSVDILEALDKYTLNIM